MPSGGAASGEMSGAATSAGAAVSDLVAAAVRAFKSIRPESSRVAAPLGTGAGATGRDDGRLAADVSALSENSTEDSLRAPVPEPPPLAAELDEPRPKPPPPPPRPAEPCSGALVATSSSLPAASMPPNKSGAGARAAVRAAARAGLAAAEAHGAAAGAAGVPVLRAATTSSTSPSGFQSAKPSAQR